jgi:choline kinase
MIHAQKIAFAFGLQNTYRLDFSPGLQLRESMSRDPLISSTMKAMILAAGFGTRLFPLTIDRTKPAIPFLGKPLVGYVAEYLASFGFKEVVVNLHHQPESVIAALGDGSRFGVHIDYTHEVPDILGTAGALDKAREYLGDEAFLVINGKIITDIDISAAVETHKRSGAIATMVLKPNIKREKFTIVLTEGDRVTGLGGHATPLTDGRDPRHRSRDFYSVDVLPGSRSSNHAFSTTFRTESIQTSSHLLQPGVGRG